MMRISNWWTPNVEAANKRGKHPHSKKAFVSKIERSRKRAGKLARQRALMRRMEKKA